MSDDDDGHAAVGEFVNKAEDVADGFWVESGSWLIEKKNFWIHHHSANDGDALFFAARKARWVGVFFVREPDVS